jgi:hypothetical protein
MKRLSIILLVLTFGLPFFMLGQTNFSIQGSWECYLSLDDTSHWESVQLWYFFDTSKVSVLFVTNYGLPPEDGSIMMEEEYTFENDTLTTFSKDRTNFASVQVLNNDLISLLPLGMAEEERLYLKRVLKE